MHFLTTKLSHINIHFEHFVCFIIPPVTNFQKAVTPMLHLKRLII
nr:MAG TPA: hypothetical protein [Caudoviricetes sp.]